MLVRICRYVLFGLIAIFLGAGFSARADLPRVYVVGSYHKESGWASAYGAAIEEVLSKVATLRFFELDTLRLPESQVALRVAGALDAIDSGRPELVILGDDDALRLLGDPLRNRGIPIVFLGINANPRSYFSDGNLAGATGVLERPLVKRHIELVKQLNPEARSVLLVFDESTTSVITRDDPYFLDGRRSHSFLGLRVEALFTDDFPAIQQAVRTAHREYDAIFLGGVFTMTDKDGSLLPFRETQIWIWENSTVPVFGFWRPTVENGHFAGGYVIDGYTMGRQAAELASRILAGAPVDSLKIERMSKGVLMFSRTGLERWGVVVPEHLASHAIFVD